VPAPEDGVVAEAVTVKLVVPDVIALPLASNIVII
jgi:hypothetical protein